jgi:hypothetical protein
MDGNLSFTVEPASGIIRVVGQGMWTADQACAFFARLERQIAARAEDQRPVRVLVDLRQSQVQTLETADAMTSGTSRFHRLDEYVAVVSPSALHRMQVKATARARHLGLFQDMNEAHAWLIAQTATVD